MFKKTSESMQSCTPAGEPQNTHSACLLHNHTISLHQKASFHTINTQQRNSLRVKCHTSSLASR